MESPSRAALSAAAAQAMGRLALTPALARLWPLMRTPPLCRYHAHSPECNHKAAPAGAVWCAALAGYVSELQKALARGGSTEEADEVRGDAGGAGVSEGRTPSPPRRTASRP